MFSGGRFLSVDPVMDMKANLPNPQRWNRYAYVSNNPVNKIDPDGRDEFMIEQRLGDRNVPAGVEGGFALVGGELERASVACPVSTPFVYVDAIVGRRALPLQ